MPITPIRSVGDIGINKDTSPVLLPPNGWSDGRNVRFDNSSASKITGHQSILTTNVEPHFLIYWGYEDSYVYADETDIFKVNAANTSTSIKPSDVTFTTNGIWQGSLFNGGYTLVFNNTLDTPRYISGGDATVAELPDWPTDYTAGILRPFQNALIAGNISIGGDTPSELPGSILVSSQAAPGAIPSSWTVGASLTTTADEFELAQTEPVLEIVDYRGTCFIFTGDSIHSLQLAQGDTATRVQNLNYGNGCLATGCVQQYEGGLFVVDRNDIYTTSGSGDINSVSDHRMRDYFFDNLSAEFYENTFVVRNIAQDEMWVCYPNLESEGDCNEALLWDYRNNTWAIRDLPNVRSATTGPIPLDDAFADNREYLTFNGYRSILDALEQSVTVGGTESNQSPTPEPGIFNWTLAGDANTIVDPVAEVQTITFSGATTNIADVQSFTLTGRSNVVVPATAEVVEIGVQDTLDYTNPLGTYFGSPGSVTHALGDLRSWPTGDVTPTNSNYGYTAGVGGSGGTGAISGKLVNNTGAVIDFTNGRCDLNITVTVLPAQGAFDVDFRIQNGLQNCANVQMNIPSIGTYTLTDLEIDANGAMLADEAELDLFFNATSDDVRGFSYTVNSLSLSTNQTAIDSDGYQPFPDFSINNTSENISAITGTFAEPTGTQTDAEAAVASIRAALEADTAFTNDFTFTELVDLPNAKAARYTANVAGDYEDFTYTITGKTNFNTGTVLTVSTEGMDTEGVSSMYTLTDGSMTESTSFSSSVALATDNDRASILSSIETAVDTNTETPINYTATIAGDVVTLTAVDGGAAAGDWTLAINNQGQTGDSGGTLVATFANDTPGVTTETNIIITNPLDATNTVETTLIGAQTSATIASNFVELLSFISPLTNWTPSNSGSDLILTHDIAEAVDGLFTISISGNELTATVAETTAGVDEITGTEYSLSSFVGNTVLTSGTLASDADADAIGLYMTQQGVLQGSLTYVAATNTLTYTYLANGLVTRPIISVDHGSGNGTLAFTNVGDDTSGVSPEQAPSSLYTITLPTGFFPPDILARSVDTTRSQTLNQIRDTINRFKFTPVDISASVIGNVLNLVFSGFTTSDVFSISVDNQDGDGDITFGTVTEEDVSRDSTEIHAADITNTFNGETFSAFVERKVMDMGDLEATKWNGSVYPIMSGDLEMRIAAKGTESAGVTTDLTNRRMTIPNFFDIQKDYKVDPRSNGRFFNIRFSSEDDGEWKLDGYSITTENADRR